MTVAQNVAFGLEERQLAARARSAASVQRGARAGGTRRLRRRAAPASSPAASSSASRSRARSRSSRSVLLLDEPLSNLDAKLRVQTRPGVEAAAAAPGHHHDLRHPRPGGGDDHRRPDRGDGPGRDPAGRHADGALRPPGEPVRRRVRRLDQHLRRAGRARRGRRLGTCVVDIDGLGRVRVPVGARSRRATPRRDGGDRGARWPSRSVRTRCASPAAAPATDSPSTPRSAPPSSWASSSATSWRSGRCPSSPTCPHARFVEALAPGARARFAVAPKEILILAEPR